MTEHKSQTTGSSWGDQHDGADGSTGNGSSPAQGAVDVEEAVDKTTEGETAADVTAAAVPPETEAGEVDFLGELALAMHVAAESRHERIVEELERRRADQIDASTSRASSESDDLKTASEGDIDAIDVWAAAETERIRLKRERRIDARREQLVDQLERHRAMLEREVQAVEAAVDAHRTRLDGFFQRVETESDPAQIVRVAATLPPLPSLSDIAEAARRRAAPESAPLDDEPGGSSDEPGGPAGGDGAGEDVEVGATGLVAIMDPAAASEGVASAARPWESAPKSDSVPETEALPPMTRWHRWGYRPRVETDPKR